MLHTQGPVHSSVKSSQMWKHFSKHAIGSKEVITQHFTTVYYDQNLNLLYGIIV